MRKKRLLNNDNKSKQLIISNIIQNLLTYKRLKIAHFNQILSQEQRRQKLG